MSISVLLRRNVRCKFVAYLSVFSMQLIENSVWNSDVNGKPAINQLTELVEVKETQKDLTRASKEWADSKQEIKELEAELKKVREEMGTVCMIVKQLQDYYRQFNKELKDLIPGTKKYIAKTADLRDVSQVIQITCFEDGMLFPIFFRFQAD